MRRFSTPYLGSAKTSLCDAEPTYGPSGELEDGGADLTMGGMCSYYHDLIYLAAIVQVASILSNRIWWSFLVVSSLYLFPRILLQSLSCAAVM